MLKPTKTIQIPKIILNIHNFKEGELYTITNNVDEHYQVSGLQRLTETSLFFDDGMVITAEQLHDGTFKLSPVETYLDRWIAIYTPKLGYPRSQVSTSFFVAYDDKDALIVAKEIAKTNPKLINMEPELVISMEAFMDNFGYMPHGAVHALVQPNIKIEGSVNDYEQ